MFRLVKWRISLAWNGMKLLDMFECTTGIVAQEVSEPSKATTSKCNTIAIPCQIQVHEGTIVVAWSIRVDPFSVWGCDIGRIHTDIVQTQDDGFFPIKGQYRIFGVGSDPSYGIQSNHVVRSKVYWISWPKLNGTLDCLVLSIRDVDQLLYRIRHDNAPLDVATFC